MRYILFFTVIIFCFQDCSSCDPATTNCSITYRFEVPIEILPLSDTLKIGDTLWVSSVIPYELEDYNTGDLVGINDFIFNLYSTINNMDTLGAPDAEHDFNWINKSGTQNILASGPYFVSSYQYEDGEDGKRLRIGLVCKKSGLYKIAFYYLTEDLTGVNLTDSDCLQNIELYNILDDGGDNNYYLLENNPNPVAAPEEFKKHAIYAFMVSE